MSAVLATSWIGVNSSQIRATDRYEQILTYDKKFAQYAYENLARHYYSRHELSKAISALEKAVSFSYNVRLYTLLSIYYDEDDRIPDAIRILRTVLEKDPQLDGIRHDMINLLSRAGEYDELLTVAREGTLYHPTNPIYHYVYGWLLIRKGLIREGAEELLEAKRLNPPRRISEQIDNTLRQLREDGRL
jgi:tetratricopeptide (TPR) repeat protein